MSDIAYIGRDRNWQEESTTYWFQVSNCPMLTDIETIGVVEGRNAGLVWDDSDPIPVGETRNYLERLLADEVTDDMRMAR